MFPSAHVLGLTQAKAGSGELPKLIPRPGRINIAGVVPIPMPKGFWVAPLYSIDDRSIAAVAAERCRQFIAGFDAIESVSQISCQAKP